MLGLVKSTSGAVEFHSEPVQERTTSYRIERGMSVVSENRRITGPMPVKNLKMGAYLRKDPDAIKEVFQRVLTPFRASKND